jgi:hypothetical protein
MNIGNCIVAPIFGYIFVILLDLRECGLALTVFMANFTAVLIQILWIIHLKKT